ncbi:MAG: hypothetical protein M1820_004659 [Bogoriella megaspora]|nr:MAG: hypothetical protein M1820_004659 [Bogoriella megaspora]
MLFSVVSLSLFATGSLASPLPDILSSLIERQDGASTTCPDPLNTPWDESTFDCQHKYAMDDKGNCKALFNNDKTTDTCSAYCEVQNSWFPGPESPFLNSACAAGDSCTLAVGNSTSITNSWSINMGLTGNSGKITSAELTGAFNFGASYTYSKTVTYTVTETHTRPANSTSDCGYYTFVPYYLSSCGTLTIGPYNYEAFIGGASWQCGDDDDKLSSTGNWCNSSPYTVDGQAQGQVVWVGTECNGGGLLPLDQQQPIYQHSGVSLGKVPSGE